MARVTVEDCIIKIENRFDLIVLASHRGKEISAGDELTLPRDNDKNPVVSLREIAEETISPKNLKEGLITSLQTQVTDDDISAKNLEENENEIEEPLEEPKTDLEKSFSKFNVQVPDRYEDI